VEVITPTTTSEVLTLPKPKVSKVKIAIKPKVSPDPTPPATGSMPVTNKIDEPQSQPPKHNWFVRVLDSIGSFFYNLF
jgi:hypothetical protein